MFLVFIGIVVLTALSPRFGVPGVVVVIGALLAVYWVRAIIDLIRIGPGGQPQWWLGSLAVVVLLGPLGALVYRTAAPSFTDAAVTPEESRLRQDR